MSKPKIFIGSSGDHEKVAKAIAICLEAGGCGIVTVWNENVFNLNDNFLSRLLLTLEEYDFALLIWASDDATQSRGKLSASPRDNVVFECGLFMGAMGKDRVFVVCDNSRDLKVPSDFAGITLAFYDGERIKNEAASAVREACDLIAGAIGRTRFPELVGKWRSRYALAGVPGHPEMVDYLEVAPAKGGISISSAAKTSIDPYVAHGHVDQHHVRGTYRATEGNGLSEGFFILTVNIKATIMYGYSSAHDESGAFVYVSWVLVKDTGQSDTKFSEQFSWGQTVLTKQTISPALSEHKSL